MSTSPRDEPRDVARPSFRLLLVEDNPGDADLAAERLNGVPDYEFELVVVSHLGRALEVLGESRIDAVILDLNLPDSQGIETLRRLRSVDSEAAIVVLSGDDDPELRHLALHEGAQDFIGKNESNDRLLTRSILYGLERFKALERLRQSQKMEAVGQLTGGVAHDFNNLLQVIMGNAEVLTKLAADTPIGRNADFILRAAEQGAELTSRLLAFARRQSLTLSPVDTETLIERVAALARRTIGEDVMLTLAPGAGGFAMADQAQLEAALLNLCINARDAMPEGGQIRIETGVVEIDGKPIAGFDDIEAGRYVRIAVSDTGTGMPPDVVRAAFEPYFTTKAPGKGTGLGLSMVYGLMRQLGGQARIDSTPGEGTTIELLIPAAVEAQSPKALPLPAAAESLGERILVVEDNDLLRESVAAQLVALGYRVTSVPDSVEALEVLADGEEFDLLFTDVILPSGFNGMQLADAALLRHPHIHVLFTSGYAERAAAYRARLCTDADLLAKPYRQEELARRVRAALDRPAHVPGPALPDADADPVERLDLVARDDDRLVG